jgi:hypothetical protein
MDAMGTDHQATGTHRGEAPGEIAPVEVIPGPSGEAGVGQASGGAVRFAVRGGTVRAGGGCMRLGCCIAWVALVALGVLVGIIWLVKAIWVRV